MGRESTISQSDREWMALQSQLREDEQFANSTEQMINAIGVENDEQHMNIDSLQAVIAEKEQANERKRVAALEHQDRLIWELAFAMKRWLVEEKGATTMEGVALSQLPVSTILKDADEEDPQPQDWMQWIEQKYRQQQP